VLEAKKLRSDGERLKEKGERYKYLISQEVRISYDEI